ncbi:glycoside hydrolase family 16 protein [Halococcus thailandensis]|uniref:glycoside hydrolase family 16 protein n=1 Tax=Halococcus thailandensis TaxID=335952 RepID=UPI001375E13D|nr:family 16 glycosylhydrolase [Halococcus thailandensis]
MAADDQIVGEGGPPRSDWKLSFADDFEGSDLNTDHWDVGWGWGTETNTSPTQIVAENVIVRNGTLRFSGTHDGTQIFSGAVNTRNKVTFGPGSYVEAKVDFVGRPGFHNAVWSKPNSERWPPEIDVVEFWESGTGLTDRYLSRHHVHYSASTVPGDNSTARDSGTTYTPGGDLTQGFHIYGVEWRSDRISYYVDGKNVAEFSDETMLTAMRRGAPFYLMVNLNINNTATAGTADTAEPWGEAMVLDWIRLWKR